MDINRTEEFLLNSWPAEGTSLYDGWVLRFSGGYTLRANSVYPIYSSAIDVAEKVRLCEYEYARRNLPAVFKVTRQSTPRGLDEILAGLGYTTDSFVRVLQIQCGEHSVKYPVMVKANRLIDEDWLSGFLNCKGVTDVQQRLLAKQLHYRMNGKLAAVSKLGPNGRAAGYGLGFIQNGCACISDVVVAPEYRGRGYAKDIMYALMNFAREKGAGTVFLQVTAGNTAAEQLYKRLGFSEAYKSLYE